MFPLPQATLVSRKKMIGVMEPSAGQIEVSQKEKKTSSSRNETGVESGKPRSRIQRMVCTTIQFRWRKSEVRSGSA